LQPIELYPVACDPLNEYLSGYAHPGEGLRLPKEIVFGKYGIMRLGFTSTFNFRKSGSLCGSGGMGLELGFSLGAAVFD